MQDEGIKDIELYEGLLGLTPPWEVEAVKLDNREQIGGGEGEL